MKSFVDAVRGHADPISKDSVRNLFFPQSFHDNFIKERLENSFLKKPDSKDGMPAILLSEHEITSLSEKFKFTLVGKFANRRPKIDNIRKRFGELKLLGGWHVGLLDGRHILIQLEREEDYTLIFSLSHFIIESCQLKFLKWNADFDYYKEPSIAPVWINLPGLKLHLFHKEILFSIATIYGKPLKIDQPTSLISRPSTAKVLVEMDVTLDQPRLIWLGTLDNGYWQKVELENVPLYCSHCKMFGHSIEKCFRFNPGLRSSRGKSDFLPPKTVSEKESKSSHQADLQMEDVLHNVHLAPDSDIHSELDSLVCKLVSETIENAVDLEESEAMVMQEADIYDDAKQVQGVDVQNDVVEREFVEITKSGKSLHRSKSLDCNSLLEELHISNEMQTMRSSSSMMETLLSRDEEEQHGDKDKFEKAESEPDTPVNLQYKQCSLRNSESDHWNLLAVSNNGSASIQLEMEKARMILEDEWTIQKSKKRKSGNKGKKNLELVELPKRITRRNFVSPNLHK